VKLTDGRTDRRGAMHNVLYCEDGFTTIGCDRYAIATNMPRHLARSQIGWQPFECVLHLSNKHGRTLKVVCRNRHCPDVVPIVIIDIEGCVEDRRAAMFWTDNSLAERGAAVRGDVTMYDVKGPGGPRTPCLVCHIPSSHWPTGNPRRRRVLFICGFGDQFTPTFTSEPEPVCWHHAVGASCSAWCSHARLSQTYYYYNDGD